MIEENGGGCIDNIKVINLDKFIAYTRDRHNKVIIGGGKGIVPSIVYFVKDIKPTCEVFFYDDEETKVDMTNLGEFEYDNSMEIGNSNIKEEKAWLLELKEDGESTVAVSHAEQYIKFKEKHIGLPEICGLELTDNCNLKCPNCPNSYLAFHKGYMDDKTFEKIIEYIPLHKDEVFGVHGMGEPLLHPKLIPYLNRLADIGVNIEISTNGILLDDDLARKILSALARCRKSIFLISFHTRVSVEKWKMVLKLIKEYQPNNIEFKGQVLEHNKKDAHKWLSDIGITDPYDNQYIRHITSHSWAGNVVARRKEYQEIEVKNRIRNCYYLRNRKVAVRWDGTLRCCCYDANETALCGNIFEFKNAEQNPHGYNLCRNCDPDWTTGFQ